MMTEDMMLGGAPMYDELAMIDQDLNMTRRATRPFVPVQDPAYCDLQRQVQLLESLPNTCVRAPRKTSLLTRDKDMAIRSNGFNYWFYNNMLGPTRD